MRPFNFDLDVLRSLAVGVELGNFSKAAERLGRSTSAISAQLKKLEEQVGAPVLAKSGRGLVLTPAGERLLGYAQRLLDLNDEAAAAVRGADLEGEVRLGLQEDFGEGLLGAVLGGFARAHPKVRIEARLARNTALLEQVDLHRLDLALAWAAGGKTSPRARRVGKVAMRWIGPLDWGATAGWSGGGTVPLVSMEAPCLMRSAAVAALDRARIPWRVACTSPSLSGVWAAVGAGLGITVRTGVGLPPQLKVLDGLPALPTVGLNLHRAEARPSPAVRRLEEILSTHLDGLMAPWVEPEPARPAPRR